MSSTDPRPVALVTGAARRVGRAMALRLAETGFDVAFTYLNSRKEADGLVEELRAKSSRPLAIRADLTDPAAALASIAKPFGEAFQRLDVLINNASLYEPDATGDAALGQMRRLWAVHVESPLLLCRCFFPLLQQSAQGRIINLLDLLAERPMPAYLAYCSSKAGLWNLTLGLARELAPRVTVNGIAPGIVDWPDDLPPEKRGQYLRRVPLARPGTPQDVAEAAMFLCTGGSYLTGQILRLDGGRSIA